MSFISSDGSRGDARGAQALTLFLDQTEARRAAKMFFETIPPSPFIWRSGSAIDYSGFIEPIKQYVTVSPNGPK